MSLPAPARWRAARTCATTLSAALLAVGLSAAAASAHMAGQTPRPSMNPFAPAYHHPYRYGAVPTIAQMFRMNNWQARHPGVRAITEPNLTYGGGIRGIGVTTGPEKVYLVFFGSQWGTKATDGHGNLTLSHDSSGEAPYLRSEEHRLNSSHPSISYAVFCLKKK